MLTKPGIIMGNLITMASGFALASKGHFDGGLFLATALGLGLIIASAGVLNNYLDREVDKKMALTKNRALAKGLISGKSAIPFALILHLLGLLTLVLFTNLLTVTVALGGFFTYILLYGIYKFRSIHGTFVGSLAGAVPPVVGYVAVSNRLDAGALILFLILVLWQMPHFFAIALFRLKDYTAAAIPVLPVKKGVYATKVQMMVYIIAFFLAASMLPFLGYTGYPYLASLILLGLAWLWLSLQGFKSTNDALWARKMFSFSLVVILGLCLTISVESLLDFH